MTPLFATRSTALADRANGELHAGAFLQARLLNTVREAQQPSAQMITGLTT